MNELNRLSNEIQAQRTQALRAMKTDMLLIAIEFTLRFCGRRAGRRRRGAENAATTVQRHITKYTTPLLSDKLALMSAPASHTAGAGAAASSSDGTIAAEKPRICCSCPVTKRPRDICIVEKGEENCKDEIEAHNACLRTVLPARLLL